jgi:hypothetical protein
MSCSDALGKADPRDWPQKIKCKLLMASVLHDHSSCREARSSSQSYFNCKISKINEGYKAVDLNDRPEFLLSSLSICSVDLTDDRKLGYRFTSAEELEEVDISPRDKP